MGTMVGVGSGCRVAVGVGGEIVGVGVGNPPGTAVGTERPSGVGVGLGLGVVLFQLLTSRSLAKARGEAEIIVKRAHEDARTAGERAEIENQKKMLVERERVESDLHSVREELREAERASGVDDSDTG